MFENACGNVTKVIRTILLLFADSIRLVRRDAEWLIFKNSAFCRGKYTCRQFETPCFARSSPPLSYLEVAVTLTRADVGRS